MRPLSLAERQLTPVAIQLSDMINGRAVIEGESPAQLSD